MDWKATWRERKEMLASSSGFSDQLVDGIISGVELGLPDVLELKAR